MKVKELNIITLAYIGDAIYELYIREKMIKNGFVKVDELQKEVTKYVSAKGQASALDELLKRNLLQEEEIDIIKRARNNKRSIHPKHTSLAIYKKATGFEALIGYLYLTNNQNRLYVILNEIEVKSCIFTEKI